MKKDVDFMVVKNWVRFGAREKIRNILIHILTDKLGDQLSSSSILKTHVLSGCDVTSRIGTKSSAMKINPERFLQAFGVGEPSDIAFKSAERYLVNVIQPSSNCMTFDELRYEMYRTHNKGLSELIPTSYSLHGHLLRSYYFVNFCLSLEQSDIHQNNLIPSPLNFGWKRVNGILLPQKYLRIMPSQYVLDVAARKVVQKNVAVNLSNVPNIANDKIAVICKDIVKHAEKVLMKIIIENFNFLRNFRYFRIKLTFKKIYFVIISCCTFRC